LARDAELERAADRPVEARHLGAVELTRGSERVDARAPERLVRIDVPDAGDRTLVEKRRLRGCASTFERSSERGGGERSVERLPADTHAQVLVELARLEEEPRSEAADVAVGDVRSVV